ncbi:MAG TPA: ABC transporter substrate-binding protein [Gemmatimonadaceae bacterium]|nr:ABC transporter substrate-binding protein [Gemmatimonadaceae bacterium]
MNAVCRILRAALAGTLLITGCRGSDRQDQNPGTLTVLYPVDERSWAFYVPAQFLVFLPLTERGQDGRMHGWLARSWEHSADWRTWTVRLRSDARWHDGRQVTAADAKFSLELLANPEIGAEAPNAYSVRVLDDTTFVVTFRQQPSEYWMYYDPMYPKHLLEKLDPGKYYEWDFWTNPIGNGPYRYVRHLPKTMIEFEANPDYIRGKPKIGRLVLKFGEPVVTELLSGNVDAIPWIQEADLLKLRGDERFRVYTSVKPDHIRAVIWNHRNPLFSERGVRHALTLAVDRRALLQTLNLPDAVPTFDVLFTHEQFYRGEFLAGLPSDRQRANALLDSVGWRDSNGDGVRDRNGRAFRFTAIVQPDQSFARAAVFIQSQLKEVGVHMEITTLDAHAAAARVKNGAFDAAVWVVNNSTAGDGGHRDYFGSSSRIGYRNAQAAALLESASVAFNPAQVDSFYRKLMPIFQAELPVTFLYPLVRTTLVHRRVRGLSSPYRDDPLWYAGELWLDGGRSGKDEK